MSVSLVITCYEQGRFLAEAIESALAQERPFDEIVVVDDGSTDDTAQVAARYPRVRYVHQANRGLAAARNRGIEETKGERLVFLDADDVLLPGAVAAGLACFARHPDAAFVYGHFRCIDEHGGAGDTRPFQPCLGDAYEAFLRRNAVGMHAAVMYRSEALREIGGFDPRWPACEDHDVYLRLARRHPIASHPNIVALYRRHGGGMSRDARRMLEASLAVLRRQRPLLSTRAQRAAWREGVRNARHGHGSQLVYDVADRLRAGAGRARIPGDVAALLLRAPTPLAAALARTGIARWRRRRGRAPLAPVALGDLRRLEPVSRLYGFDRGTPVDRYYIEAFLAAHAGDVRGRVLEIGDATYTHRFGGARVARADVLHVEPGGAATTFVSDLATGEGLPDEAFDCLIVTQTLQLVFDLPAAVRTMHRILRPGGALLLTVPGTISQIEQGPWRSTWCWGFTPLAVRRLLETAFPPERVAVEAHGNVLASVAFLEGLAAEELVPGELEARDELYPLLVTARAAKPAAGGAAGPRPGA